MLEIFTGNALEEDIFNLILYTFTYACMIFLLIGELLKISEGIPLQSYYTPVGLRENMSNDTLHNPFLS